MADPIILDIEANIKGLNKQLSQLQKDLDKLQKTAEGTGKEMEEGANDAAKATKKATNETSKLDNAIGKIGKRILAAFAVERVISFTKEVVTLAAEAEGVEQGFNRLNNPRILSQLRAATRGTVSDLELMKQAVRANNFKIPLEQLGSLFEFARRRAKETGESVDFLVDSIVTGIGRKSPLILDNLGISAIELRKRFNGITIASAEVGDVARIVGDIAIDELDKMGEEAETTADKLAQVNAEWQNIKRDIGAGVIDISTSGIDALLNAFAGEGVRGFNQEVEQLANTIESRIQGLDELELQQAFKDAQIELEKLMNTSQNFANMSEDNAKRQASEAFNTLNNLFFQTDERRKQLELDEDISEVREIILKRLKEVGIVTDKAEKSNKGLLESLEEQLKVQRELLPLAKTQSEVNKILDEQERIQQNINDILNARSAMSQFSIGMEDDSDRDTDPGDIGDFLNNAYDEIQDREAQAAENRKQREQDVTDFYEEQLQARIDADQEYIDKKAEFNQWELDQEKLKHLATLDSAAALFGALGSLMTEHAEAAKAFAVFDALISAYVAIQNTLASVPYPANLLASAAIAVQAFGNVQKITSTSVPKFYDGTDYLGLNGNPKGKDTIPIMAHEGEAIIKASENAKHKGLAKAWNAGKLDEWITANKLLPALIVQKREFEEGTQRHFATNIANSILGGGMDDHRIVNELKRGRRVNEEILKQGSSRLKRRNWRA